jgi:hypothetical protein
MSLFVQRAKIHNTNEKSAQGQMPDSPVVPTLFLIMTVYSHILIYLQPSEFYTLAHTIPNLNRLKYQI